VVAETHVRRERVALAFQPIAGEAVQGRRRQAAQRSGQRLALGWRRDGGEACRAAEQRQAAREPGVDQCRHPVVNQPHRL
jgi:hypothetical protein